MNQTTLKSTMIAPYNGQGLLKLLVPGTPNCQAPPAGDGVIGVEGQNCPFQMYTIAGVFVIVKAGQYTFCTTSAYGCVAQTCSIFIYLGKMQELIIELCNLERLNRILY